MVPQFLLTSVQGIWAATLQVLARLSVVAQLVSLFQGLSEGAAPLSTSIVPQGPERIEVRRPSRGKVARNSGHGQQQQG
jgi:hypothetical protein